MLDNTKHTCGGPKWGKLTAGCRRCDELRFGASPRRGWGWRKREDLRCTLAAIKAHDCRKSNCGPVCTAFDW